MKKSDETKMLEVFNVSYNKIKENGNKIALLLDEIEENTSSSFAKKSWDRYFRDLSFGSYRPFRNKEKNQGRERVWHYLLKNLALVDRLYAKENSDKETQILDIGCSSGYLRRFIEGNHNGHSSNNLYYWGIDIRKDMIIDATCDESNIESGASGDFIPSVFAVHDVGKSLPFKSKSFDYVVIFEMIKYLTIKDGKTLISETKRVLKKGGTLVISTPTSYEYYKQKRPDHIISLAPNELIEILESNQFGIENVYGSQSLYKYLKDNIKANHKEVFNLLNEYLPNEIITSIFSPLYPEYSTQITLYAHA